MSSEKCFAIKSDIASKYADMKGITEKEAKQRVNDVIKAMVSYLVDPAVAGVMIRNMFTIEKTVKPARKGKMPINGVVYETPSAQKLKITTGKTLSEMLNEKRV